MSHPADGQSVADRVRLRRLALGLTQEDLARRANVTVSTVRNIERGRTTQRSYRLRDIFGALGIEDDQTAAEIARVKQSLIDSGIEPVVAESAARNIVRDQQERSKPS
jgi:transcriptional regulator with XRE-family HTH domain